MTPPRLGWLLARVDRPAGSGRVIVTMIHPDYPLPCLIDAPDESTAVAWAMIRRNGTCHWKPKPKRRHG